MHIDTAYWRRVADLRPGETFLADKFLSVDLKVEAERLKVCWSLEMYEWMLVLMKHGKLLDITADLPKHSLRYARTRYFAKHPDSPRANLPDFAKKDKDQLKVAVRIAQAKGLLHFLAGDLFFQVDDYKFASLIDTWADVRVMHAATKLRV